MQDPLDSAQASDALSGLVATLSERYDPTNADHTAELRQLWELASSLEVLCGAQTFEPFAGVLPRMPLPSAASMGRRLGRVCRWHLAGGLGCSAWRLYDQW